MLVQALLGFSRNGNGILRERGSSKASVRMPGARSFFYKNTNEFEDHMNSELLFLVAMLFLFCLGVSFSIIIWFRFSMYLDWMLEVNHLLKMIGFSFSDEFLRSSGYKWYVRIITLMGFVLMMLPLLLFLYYR